MENCNLLKTSFDMPKKLKNEAIQHAYFRWVLVLRNGVWYADGRSNAPNPGRHSLETSDRREALRQLPGLDRKQAERLGLAPRSKNEAAEPMFLALGQGRDLYLQHANRPELLGGVRQSTHALYRSNLDAALAFLEEDRAKFWNQVDASLLEKYAKHLEEKGLTPKTIKEKLKLVKQVKNWLIEERHITGCEPVKLKLNRVESERHYCWTTEEVEAMLGYCKTDPRLFQLHDIILCLAATGLRISELTSLRWSDFDFKHGVLRLTDESGHGGQSRRQLKNGRSRSLPMYPDLRALLEKRPQTAVYVFTAPRGGKLDDGRIRQEFITEVVEKLADRFPSNGDEQGFRDGRFHSFRHFFCSRCANENMPQQMVMEWIGHADSEMVRHYYHLHDRESREKMNQFNLFGRTTGRSGSAAEEVTLEGDASVAS